MNVFGSCLEPAFTPLSLSYQERRLVHLQYRISLSGILAPGLLVDDRVPVGRVPALGLGSSLVSHASKYSRKNDSVSCHVATIAPLAFLACLVLLGNG